MRAYFRQEFDAFFYVNVLVNILCFKTKLQL